MRINGITYVARKSRRVRFFIVLVLILALFLLLVTAIVSAYTAWNLVHPQKVPVEPFQSNIVLEYRDVSFQSADKNVVLNGWLFQVKGSGKAAILAHGYGKNRLQFAEKTLDVIKTLTLQNYNVLAFDMRGSGKSGGKTVSFGLHEKDDLLGAISYLKSQGASEIVLIGFSTGASACILAAAESKDVVAVIADTPYASLNRYLDDGLSQSGILSAFPFNLAIKLSVKLIGSIDIEKADPEKAIAGMKSCDVLFIHSSSDAVIPLENSSILYSVYSRAGNNNTEIWETKASGHAESYLQNPEEYMQKVLGFLSKKP